MHTTVVFMVNYMNNMLSYCWLIVSKIRVFDKDLPVPKYFSMSSHFQDGVLLPRLGDATSSKSIRTKTDREKACHDKNNSTVTEFIFLPQLQ